MKLRNNKNEEGNSDSRVFRECRIIFVVKKLIFPKSNCKDCSRRKKKWKMKIGINIEVLKAGREDNFMGHTQRESYLIWSSWPRLNGFTIRL